MTTQGSWPVTATLLILALALVVSAVTDLLRRTIYDAVTGPALAVQLLLAAWVGGTELLLRAIAGTACLWLPFFIGSFLETFGGGLRIRWAPERPVFGEGDAKLLAVVGAATCWCSPLAIEGGIACQSALVPGAAPGLRAAFAVLVWVSVTNGAQAMAALAWARLRGREKPVYVPMGLAIAVGTLLAWTVGVP